MKMIEEYTRFIIEIVQEDVKEGKLFIEKIETEIAEDKNEVTVDFVFDINVCAKKMRVTFDYDEFANRIKCKKTTLQN